MRTELSCDRESIDRYLTLLYGERTLSDKEKKKIAKFEKFNAKQKKAEEQEVVICIEIIL